MEVEVVGLSRTHADFGRFKGVFHLSPAFVERYGERHHVYTGVHVGLSDERAPSERARTVSTRTHRRASVAPEGVDIGPSPFGDDAATNNGLGTIATTLRLVALVATLAGAVVIALALARLTPRRTARSADTCRARLDDP